MKNRFATLLIILAFFGCKEKNSSPENISDFQYPSMDLSKETTFVYERLGSMANERSSKIKVLVEHKSIEGISIVQRNSYMKFDSVIASKTDPNVTLEVYRFDYDSLNNYRGVMKGEIIENTFDSRVVRFRKGNGILDCRLDIKDVIDTTFFWKNENLPAIYLRSVNKDISRHKYIPFIGETREYKGYAIYAKNLGLVQYGGLAGDGMVEWKLIEIK